MGRFSRRRDPRQHVMRIVAAARQAQGEGRIDAAALGYKAAVEVVRELRAAEPDDEDNHRQLGSCRRSDRRRAGAEGTRPGRLGRSASALVVADAAVTWYVVGNGGVDPQVLAVAAATFGHHVNPPPVPAEYVVFDLARVLADQSEIVLACGDPDVALNAALAALHIYTANSSVVGSLPTPQQRTVAGQSLHKALRIARAITSARGIGDERIVAASVLGTRFALLPTVRQDPDAMAVVVDCLTWLRHLWDVGGDEPTRSTQPGCSPRSTRHSRTSAG